MRIPSPVVYQPALCTAFNVEPPHRLHPCHLPIPARLAASGNATPRSELRTTWKNERGFMDDMVRVTRSPRAGKCLRRHACCPGISTYREGGCCVPFRTPAKTRVTRAHTVGTYLPAGHYPRGPLHVPTAQQSADTPTHSTGTGDGRARAMTISHHNSYLHCAKVCSAPWTRRAHHMPRSCGCSHQRVVNLTDRTPLVCELPDIRQCERAAGLLLGSNRTNVQKK